MKSWIYIEITARGFLQRYVTVHDGLVEIPRASVGEEALLRTIKMLRNEEKASHEIK